MRRAPDFWWREAPTLAARLLQPLGMIYGELTARRMARPGFVLPVPVLCIGNLVAGGAGKTPTAMAFAAMLRDEGHRLAFLSRGYGRRAPRRGDDAVIRVDPGRHDAAAVGDEPLLLAGSGATYVAADRRAAAARAIADGATVLVLDDGLQNPALAKELTVAVVDGATGLGNGLCLPAGPLRAPAMRQWPFVHAVCIIGPGRLGDAVLTEAASHGLPVLRAQLRPDPAAVASLQISPVFAFAGIGRPEKFFATVTACGLELRGTRAFPDHHAFAAGELKALRNAARAQGARLVTTAKDHARLPPGFPASVLPVSLVFDAPDAARSLLAGLPPPG